MNCSNIKVSRFLNLLEYNLLEQNIYQMLKKVIGSPGTCAHEICRSREFSSITVLPMAGHCEGGKL